MADIQKLIVIHSVTDGPEACWMHTHGMQKLGLPELEIRRVPLVLMTSAAGILNDVAEYMLKAKDSSNPVREGQTMQLGSCTLIKFRKATPLEGEEGHYAYEVWELTHPQEGEAPCDRCGKPVAKAQKNPLTLVK